MKPESFKNHVVFERLEQLNQVLIAADTKSKIDIESMAFLDLGYKYIKDRLNLTIPLLVQDAELTSLMNELDAALVQINSFLGNNNSGHITNSINNFNSAINRVRNLPFLLSKSDFDFSKSIASFQQTVEDGYNRITEINVKLEQNLKDAQDDLVAKQTQIEDLEKKLAEKGIEIQNVLIKYNTEFESLKATANTDIEAEKKKFNGGIEDDRKSFKEQFETDNAEYKKIFDGQKINFDNLSNTVVTNLNTKLEEANKIVNIIGNVGVTGNYQNIANQNKAAANFFRWVALFFMVIMSGLLIWSIIELSGSEFNLYKSLIRILAAAVLTYPAIYASRESTRHRNLETKNRNLELELASIGPFIEILPEDTKQKIKESLVDKYFGNHNSDLATKKEDEEDVSINGLEKILKAILPIIKAK